METFGKLAPVCPGDMELPRPAMEDDIPIVMADCPEYMDTGIPKLGERPGMAAPIPAE